MQNRNTTDKLNPQCSKLALFANTITEICGRITMLVYYILISCISVLHFASDNQLAILVDRLTMPSVCLIGVSAWAGHM